jgi:GT2 family glycosyltransferase
VGGDRQRHHRGAETLVRRCGKAGRQPRARKMDNAMSAPAVTVLMPAYNAEAHLAEAVESILAQTFGDFEFLIIDDGSSDGTPDILRKYAKQDTRIRLERNEHNLQIAATLNKGLRSAAAPLIARMDADDIAVPDRLKLQVARFAAQPELAALGGSIRFLSETGELGGQRLDYPTEHEAVVRALWTYERNLAHPAVMFRTQAVLSLGGYRTQLNYAEDYDLWLRLSEIGLLGNLPETILYYRIHSASTSSLKSREQRICSALAWLSAYSGKNGLPDPVAELSALPTVEECRLGFSRCGTNAVMFFDKLFFPPHWEKMLKRIPFGNLPPKNRSGYKRRRP